MTRVKNPDVDLKLKYRKTLEAGLIFSLLLHFGLFHGVPEFSVTPTGPKSVELQIEVQDIPPTEQIKRPPPPARPSVPIPTLSEEVPEDITIESTELNLELAELPPPPPPPEETGIEDQYVFVPYDEAPYPIGGYPAIQNNLKYPEIARKAGIEGVVVIGILIDEKGNPIKTQILKSAGAKVGFEEAAEAAVLSVKWKPAKQRDRAVKVWVSVPIRFKLDTQKKEIAT